MSLKLSNTISLLAFLLFSANFRANAANPSVSDVITIEVVVPSTPPLTLRANAWPMPINLKFKRTINPAPDISLPFPPSHFDSPNALVLIKNNLVTMPVTATAASGDDVKMIAVRDPADSTQVGTSPFSLIPQPAVNSATLHTDQRGSFYILGWVDKNGNDEPDSNEPCAVLPVIIVDVNLHYEDSKFRTSLVNVIALDINDRFRFTTGVFNFSDYTTAGAHFKAAVDFIGGGSDGRRGVDRAYAGWCNNDVNDVVTGNYTDGTDASVMQGVAVSNKPASGVFLPGDPAPVVIAPPFLDVGEGGTWTGGNTIMLHENYSPPSSTQIKSLDNISLGVRKIIEELDSPSDSFRYQHLGHPARLLTDFSLTFDFQCYLLCWTNVQANSGSAGEAGERSYHAILRQPWTVNGSWDSTIATDPVTGDFTGTFTANAPVPSIIGPAKQEYSPVKRPVDDGVNCETRNPPILEVLAKDYRN